MLWRGVRNISDILCEGILEAASFNLRFRASEEVFEESRDAFLFLFFPFSIIRTNERVSNN
jgi:hypothetical protein